MTNTLPLSHQKVLDTVSKVIPFDKLESACLDRTIEWIKSGQPIFRIKKPDIPPKHLVSYFLLSDLKNNKLLLVEHIKAGLWLPSGGHVETDEDPLVTIQREAAEEHRIINAIILNNGSPLFISDNETIGFGNHIDVSLWYLVDYDSNSLPYGDPSEFKSLRWFSFEEIIDTDIKTLDPCLHRFVRKLQTWNR